ncbi:hypothetical protein SCA03_27330 [Streptomyces cacaoi]|uniref:Uncharacterized protein n=1 Tax=Streptomyces cacaoi TaxID=1898 RepID=A0A4Y3QYC6_STRCI|nr:hypothetical protein SCA03_27330 [Streptomyces cacaoi]
MCVRTAYTLAILDRSVKDKSADRSGDARGATETGARRPEPSLPLQPRARRTRIPLAVRARDRKAFGSLLHFRPGGSR